MSWLSWALVPFAAIILWLLSSSLSPTFPTLRGKRLLLLIAHPDDEAMFFAPTVQALTQAHLGNHVKILCLSTGDADGLGSVRREELVKSAILLGVRNAEDVLVLDDTRFPDSMTTIWDEAAIAELLRTTFAPDVAKAKKADAAKANIDALITFDKGGVSSHPNHISLYHGARAFVKDLQKGRAGWRPLVRMYTLPSVNIARKYASIVDVPITVMSSLFGRKQGGEYPDPLLAIGGPGWYRKGQQAMTEAHRSQMRWFRWGWIGISRYMVVNDLQRERVT